MPQSSENAPLVTNHPQKLTETIDDQKFIKFHRPLLVNRSNIRKSMGECPKQKREENQSKDTRQRNAPDSTLCDRLREAQ